MQFKKAGLFSCSGAQAPSTTTLSVARVVNLICCYSNDCCTNFQTTSYIAVYIDFDLLKVLITHKES